MSLLCHQQLYESRETLLRLICSLYRIICINKKRVIDLPEDYLIERNILINNLIENPSPHFEYSQIFLRI